MSSLPLQLVLYLGKRDFVDHIENVDPLGRYFVPKHPIMQAESLEGANIQEVFHASVLASGL